MVGIPHNDPGHNFPGGLQPGVVVPPPAKSNCSRAVTRSPKHLRKPCTGTSRSAPSAKHPAPCQASLPGLSVVAGCLARMGTSCLDSHHRFSKKLLGSSGHCHEGLQPLRDRCRDLLTGQVVPLAFVFLAFAAFQSNADFFILERVKRSFSENCFGIIYFSF